MTQPVSVRNVGPIPMGNADTHRGRLLRRLHIDPPLLAGLLFLSGISLIILYSAGEQNPELIVRQATRLAIGFGVAFIIAQVPPRSFQYWAPWLYGLGLLLLIAVLILGEIGKGAQRWLNFGLFRFQPSELMKIAVPMMAAQYLAAFHLPPRPRVLGIATVLIIVPVLLIVKQPDLGTSLLIGTAGAFVLLLSGVAKRLIFSVLGLLAVATPVIWHLMHDYQRQRVLTFLNPESDPLGAGYHIIQSKIAIGSGGWFGKGWLNGTQAYLDFLPESSTDFIFAVLGEEFGLTGILVLLVGYLFIVWRGMVIAMQAQDCFSRLLAGSLTLTFFIYFFVNIGMVTGLLPVVGLPLPLISYGGSSMVTLMAAFGILMSIQTHRKLVSS